MASEFGNGHKILICSDPIKGINATSMLSEHNLSMIQRGGFFFISQTIKRWEASCPIWKNVTELKLAGICALEWEAYVNILGNVRLCYNRSGDYIIWIGRMAKEAPIVANSYRWLLAEKDAQMDRSWFARLWKWKVPTKIILFAWLVWRNKILTWDNMGKRGHLGPSICIYCKADSESIQHIFFFFPYTNQIWNYYAMTLQITFRWMNNFEEFMIDWINVHNFFMALPLFTIQEIWKPVISSCLKVGKLIIVGLYTRYYLG